MIRLFLGIFLVFGSVGNLDYAMVTGTPEPHWAQTSFFIGLGFVLMYYGLQRAIKVYGQE